MSSPGASPRTRRRIRNALALSVALAAVGSVLAAGLAFGAPFGLAGSAVSPVGQTVVSVPTAISISEHSPVQTVPSSLLGVNLQADNHWNSTVSSLITGTTTRYLRFPSGECAEGVNWTSGAAYGNLCWHNQLQITMAQFVGDCEAVQCHAILQLPTEIDSPSTAKYYVNWLENTEHFVPAYYELGNEPTQWSHFQCPWSTWATTCLHGSNATPTSYPAVVVAYVKAIRQVDASTPIIGLGGDGQTIEVSQGGVAHSGYVWAKDLFAATGNSIQGISVHDYPGRYTTASSRSNFYGQLVNGDALLPNIQQARAGIAAGCPTCTGEQILVTESAMYSCGGCNQAYTNSFADALAMGVDITEAASYGAVNLDLEALYNGGHEGNWFGPALPEPVYYLYSDILAKMPLTNAAAHWLAATEISGPRMLWLAATYVAPSTWTLLALNLNVTATASIALTGTGFPTAGTFSLYRWDGTTSEPVSSSATALTSLSVAPQSMVLVVVSAIPPTTYAVTGQVSYASNGLPASGARVSIAGGLSTTTGTPGTYRLLVPDGSYVISASLSGYQKLVRTVSVAGAGQVVNFALHKYAWMVSGVVTSATTGAPISGSKVAVTSGLPYSTSSTTGSTGGYTLWLPNGTYSITASATGYASRTVSVTVADHALSLSLALAPPATPAAPAPQPSPLALPSGTSAAATGAVAGPSRRG